MAGSLAGTVTDPRAGWVGAGAVMVAVTCVLPIFLAAGLSVQIGADLDLPPEALGGAPAAFFGAMMLSSPLAGRVNDLLGTTRAIRIAVSATAVVLLLIALAGRSLPVLLGLLVLAGFANAVAQPATNALLAARIPWHRQGVAYGAKYSAIPTASMLAGLAVPALGLTIGWRWAFAAFAVLAVLGAVWPFGNSPAPVADTAPAPADLNLPRRVLVVLACGVAFAAAGGSTLAIFMVAGAVNAGWSQAGAGVLLAEASLIGIVARLLGGIRADRRGRNHLIVVVVMLAVGALGVLGMVPENRLLFALAAPIAFAAGWGWPGLFILAIVRLHASAPAAATGLTQTGTSAGCVVGPLVFALLALHASYSVAWAVNAGFLAAAAVIVLVGRRLVMQHLDTVSPEAMPWRHGLLPTPEHGRVVNDHER